MSELNFMRSSIHHLRDVLIGSIKMRVEGKLRESGYGGTEMCYFGLDANGDVICHSEEGKPEYEVCGFVEEGVITDASYGGIATIPYETLSVEQLLFTLEVVEDHGDKLI